ncbi:MAG: PEP-CTERM sorting domain-containing protein, partial [Phycisphaerae bacterium]|nr:PEP-CTERM sorting domain-containing protein [Phycisphaerae bacterium]
STSSYSGGTVIARGTLAFRGSIAATGNSPVGTGTIQLGDSIISGDAAFVLEAGANAATESRSITVAGGTGTRTIGNFGISNGVWYDGQISLAHDVILASNWGKFALITGTGNVSINTNGNTAFWVQLGGTGAGGSSSSPNTYSGSTTITQGLVTLNKTAGVDAIPHDLTIGDGLGNAATAKVQLLGSNQINDSSVVTFKSDGLFSLNGLSDTVGAISSFAATNGQISNAVTGASVLTLGASSGSYTFSGVISNTTGTLKLVKNGGYTQELTGANTYSGGTDINNGLLKVNNVSGSGLGTGPVNVNNGGTLGGTGAITAAVEIKSGGHGAPGNSVGSQSVTSLTLDSGSILDFEFNTGLGTPNDQYLVTASGGLTINGGQFNLYNEGNTSIFSTNGTYKLMQYAGSIGGTGIGALSVATGSQVAGHTYTFNTTSDAGWVDLVIGASGNNSKLWVGGTEPTTSLQTTTYAQPSFGKLLLNAATPSASVTLSSNGSDALTTNASVSLTGQAASSTASPIVNFGTVSTINVGLATNVAGDYTGTSNAVVIDNLAANSSGTSQGSDNGNAYVYVTGTVGWAKATGTTFVPAETLSASVANSTPLAGLASVVHDFVGNTDATSAELLAGATTGSGAQTVQMNWRQHTTAEYTNSLIVSDVVDLTLDVSKLASSTYVLQMSYNENDPLIGGPTSEATLAANGKIYVAWLNGSTWVNAGIVDLTHFKGIEAYPAGDLTVGDWGVDTAANKAWVVLDHASTFAVVPEPATMAFLAFGGLTMMGAALRRRRQG